MKKINIMAINNIIIGMILLIPFFISVCINSLNLLITVLGIILIFITITILIYPKEINNQNSN